MITKPPVFNVKVLVCTFNQEKALIGPISVITNLRVNLRFKLYTKVEGHASIHKTTWIVTQISQDTEDLPRPSNTTSGKTTFWHHLTSTGCYFIILNFRM